MEKFTVHTGLVAPLDRENVDTDAIIPKQFLKSIARTGFGANLFENGVTSMSANLAKTAAIARSIKILC